MVGTGIDPLDRDKLRPKNTALRCMLAAALPCVYFAYNNEYLGDEDDNDIGDAMQVCCTCCFCPTLIPSLCCALPAENWCACWCENATRTKTTTISSDVKAVGPKSNEPAAAAPAPTPEEAERL